ncbi:WASH complex subunit 1-like [Canis lupus familiaris]|uniref:WASH complex subunit 1-like n=1 Tax=Canis lupus familiaris TaxID=9615 RepID=UPI0002256317|nr:WASH complex subunit 1-like [Canis lupus familiaris]
MQSQAARDHKPGAGRLLLPLPLPPPPPPPLPPPALRTPDFSCTTLTASFPPCPEKCDRSPKEFPRQVVEGDDSPVIFPALIQGATRPPSQGRLLLV